MNVNPAPLRLGILGVGHFGRFHALKAAANPTIHLIGLHDASAERAAQIAGEVGAPALSPDAVIAAADAVIIAAPTRFHYALAEQALAAGRHVFIEKPIAASLDQADRLIALAARQGRVLQVGHIERFSAAFRTVMATPSGGRALSFEAVRAAPFRPRSLDVSVVLDLMIHDLDLILSLVPAELVEVRAVGGSVMTDLPDWAVAQLRFANGAQAQVTASRAAVSLERKLRALGPEGEMRVDFLARSLEFLAPDGGHSVENMPGWSLARHSWTDHDSLEAEQSAFIAAILDGVPHEADGGQGRAALDAALRVEAALR